MRRWFVLSLLTAALAPLPDAAAQLRPREGWEAGVLRVCADPDNLPLSNDRGEGLENKIAEVIAREWKAKLEYAWWPVRRGFFARALNGRYCDVAITAPVGLDIAAVTTPYFRSGYVIVTRKDRNLDMTSLADPRFKQLRIGVNLLNSDAENTPPAMALSKFGVVGNLQGFTTFFSDGGDRPEDIVRAVLDRKVDVSIVWGPIAGYFAKRLAGADALVLRPVAEAEVDGIPFAFSFGMAARRRDRVLRDSLQAVVERRRSEIDQILRDYGVPLFELPDSARRVGAVTEPRRP